MCGCPFSIDHKCRLNCPVTKNYHKTIVIINIFLLLKQAHFVTHGKHNIPITRGICLNLAECFDVHYILLILHTQQTSILIKQQNDTNDL